MTTKTLLSSLSHNIWPQVIAFSLGLCCFAFDTILTWQTHILELNSYLFLIFCSSLFWPWLVSPLTVFLLGITYDLISETPVGLTSFSYLFLQLLLNNQKKYLLDAPFWLHWLGFAFFYSFYVVLTSALWGFTLGHYPTLAYSWCQIILATSLYPLALKILQSIMPKLGT